MALLRSDTIREHGYVGGEEEVCHCWGVLDLRLPMFKLCPVRYIAYSLSHEDQVVELSAPLAPCLPARHHASCYDSNRLNF